MLEIQPLGPVCGASVSGVHLGRLSDDEFAAIRRALAEHEVLVFKDQDIETAEQVAFGRRFGELTVSPFSPNSADVAELIVLDNHGDGPKPLTDIWHSDETFRAEPPLATILRARIVPEFGGNTLFASMTAAYEGLSERLKVCLSGMTALHGFGRFGEMLRVDPERRHLLHKVENELPMPHHPVVRVHPETGRKALFVNKHFTLRLDGVREDESEALLELLFRQPLVAEYQLRVTWAPNTVVMWDNRSVQHYAPNDYLPQRRRMERVTIEGDVPMGDQAALDYGSVTRGVSPRHIGQSAGDTGSLSAPVRAFDR